MALESPLKKDVSQAIKDLESLNRLYNVYFQGGEDDPPRNERKKLDTQVSKIKNMIATSTNAGDKFQANSLVQRYQSMVNRWEKHLRGIENGTIIRPKKR